MTKIQNLVATVWEYENKQGEKKKQYLNIWKLITKDDGTQSIKIDCIPVAWTGWAGVYDQKEKGEKKATENNDDLPF